MSLGRMAVLKRPTKAFAPSIRTLLSALESTSVKSGNVQNLDRASPTARKVRVALRRPFFLQSLYNSPRLRSFEFTSLENLDLYRLIAEISGKKLASIYRPESEGTITSVKFLIFRRCVLLI
jgi:hypothetical protein